MLYHCRPKRRNEKVNKRRLISNELTNELDKRKLKGKSITHNFCLNIGHFYLRNPYLCLGSNQWNVFKWIGMEKLHYNWAQSQDDCSVFPCGSEDLDILRNWVTDHDESGWLSFWVISLWIWFRTSFSLSFPIYIDQNQWDMSWHWLKRNTVHRRILKAL